MMANMKIVWRQLLWPPLAAQSSSLQETASIIPQYSFLWNLHEFDLDVEGGTFTLSM
jgi:hypothetical protein